MKVVSDGSSRATGMSLTITCWFADAESEPDKEAAFSQFMAAMEEAVDKMDTSYVHLYGDEVPKQVADVFNAVVDKCKNRRADLKLVE